MTTISFTTQAADALRLAGSHTAKAYVVVKDASAKVKKTASTLINQMKGVYQNHQKQEARKQKKALFEYGMKFLFPYALVRKAVTSKKEMAAKKAGDLAQCVLAVRELQARKVVKKALPLAQCALAVRELQARKKARIHGAASKMQAFFRANKQKCSFQAQRQATTKLQAQVRRFAAKSQFQASKALATKLQSLARGVLGRKQVATRKSSAHLIGRFMKAVQPVKGSSYYKPSSLLTSLTYKMKKLTEVAEKLEAKAEEIEGTRFAGDKAKKMAQEMRSICAKIKDLGQNVHTRIGGQSQTKPEALIKEYKSLAIDAVTLLEDSNEPLPMEEKIVALHISLRKRVINHDDKLHGSWGSYHQDTAEQLKQLAQLTPERAKEASKLYDTLPLDELYKRAFWAHLQLGHTRDLEPSLKASIGELSQNIEGQKKALEKLEKRVEESKTLSGHLFGRALTDPKSSGASQQELDRLELVRSQLIEERARRIEPYHNYHNERAEHMRAQLYRVRGGLL